MKELKQAIKTILDHDLVVGDGFVSLYWASMDPSGKYIVSSDESLANATKIYEEFDGFDDACDCFLEHTWEIRP